MAMTNDEIEFKLAFKYDLVREDGRLERMCKHGIGHTVGHMNKARLKEKYIFSHGCDGCCENWPCQKADEE